MPTLRGPTEVEAAMAAFGPPEHGGDMAVAAARPCSVADCVATGAIVCQYADRRGKRCESAMCGRHGVAVGDVVYCGIHADTLHALGPGTNEHALPDLDNRTPVMVSWLARDLHDRVREVLDEFARSDSDVRILVDEHVRMHRRPQSARTWTQAWKLADHRGVYLTVAVEMPEGEESQLAVRVDDRVVFAGSPAWIVRQLSGERAARDVEDQERLEFQDRSCQAIAAAITASRSAGPRGAW